MKDFFKVLEKKKITLPDDVYVLLNSCKKYTIYNSVEQLAEAAVGGANETYYDVKYDIPGKGEYTEAIVHKVTNGISANYTDAYMRRRDPDTMVIADNLPSDKIRFKDKYGYEFDSLKAETFEWMKNQELAVFFYFAGNNGIGVNGIAIAPANAGFFAMGLAMLQRIVPVADLADEMDIDSVIYVAPTFRHTHFNGKQVVVHNRTENRHEIYSYNLYPGASGGGKSEMLQHIIREPNGQVMIGENSITGEKRLINLSLFCSFNPVTDDMALCAKSIQKDNGKVTVLDAENAWFIRVDSVNEYGDDPALEKLTIKPKTPLLFLNIKTYPNCTALIWDHTEDEPGKRCPNPRVIVPRNIVPSVVNKPVTVDVRSFGVRTPPSSMENPNYGIFGLFHILPPALAWLWRLVSPRGHANPSIIGGDGMASEGVGSYWPFATGKMVTHANLLLEQIVQTPRMRYTLVPNQYIGVWKVGFKPQLLMREYLARRGNAQLRADQYQPARCPLLGYELNYLTIEGAKIPSRFLQVHRQPEVGVAGYDAGAEMLTEFFKKELQQFLTPELNPLGRKIIEACLANASVEEYNEIIPMNYQYSFLTTKEQ